MPDKSSCSQAWRHPGAAAVLILILCGGMAIAHDVLAEFVQHDVNLEVKPEHLDVTVELTFFEHASEAERRRMDGDGDGRITRPEMEAYARELKGQLQDQLKLRLGDQRLELTALRVPELDLLGEPRVQPAHHRLRLVFFCATPGNLATGSVLTLESRLWPEWPAVVVVSGGGQGYGVLAEKPAAPLMRRLDREKTRKFNWVLTALPPPAMPAPRPPASK